MEKIRSLIKVRTDSASILARVAEAEKKMDEHFDAIYNIANRLYFLDHYTHHEATAVSENVSEEKEEMFIIVNVDTDSMIADLNKARQEIRKHIIEIRDITMDLHCGLPVADEITAAPDVSSGTAEGSDN